MPPTHQQSWALKRAHTPLTRRPTSPQTPCLLFLCCGVSGCGGGGEVSQLTSEPVLALPIHREGQRPGGPSLTSVPGELILTGRIGREKGSGLGAAGMEMLKNPVCCQDNFHFCPVTPRPLQRLLQRSKARTDPRKGWVLREQNLPSLGSPPTQPWLGVLAPSPLIPHTSVRKG